MYIRRLTICMCAGIQTCTEPDNSGYVTIICGSGYWAMYSYNVAGSAILIDSGNVPANSTYHLEVATIGSNQHIVINGCAFVKSDSVHNGDGPPALILDSDHFIAAPGGSATFSNFAYTPL